MNDTELLDRILFELDDFEASENIKYSANVELQRKDLEEFFGRTNSIE